MGHFGYFSSTSVSWTDVDARESLSCVLTPVSESTRMKIVSCSWKFLQVFPDSRSVLGLGSGFVVKINGVLNSGADLHARHVFFLEASRGSIEYSSLRRNAFTAQVARGALGETTVKPEDKRSNE